MVEIEIPDEFFDVSVFGIMVQFEGFFVQFAHISALGHLLQIFLQLDELVVLASVVGHYWDSVLQLVNVRKWSVVDQYEAGEVSIHDPQIFRIDVLVYLYTTSPIQPMLYVLLLRVHLIQYRIRIPLLTRRKRNNLKELGHPLQKTNRIRPDTHISHHLLPPIRLHRQRNIIRLASLLVTMYQGFIDIDKQSFFIGIALVSQQVHLMFLNALKGGSLYLGLISHNFMRQNKMLESTTVSALDRRGDV